MSNHSYLKVALEAVKEADIVINKYYSKDIKTTLKSDLSPVTIADKESETIIRKIIKESYPEHNIIGEEEGRTNHNSPYTWVIDPIDGTKNFMRKVPLFATQLALIKDDRVILGVSNAPILSELIYAEKGKGAYLNDERISVSNINKLDKSYLSYGGLGYFNKAGLMKNLLKIEGETFSHRGFGDFWSYHLLAQGKIDIMLEAKTKFWDIAALSLIVAEAGGKVTDLKGNSVNMKTTSIIATNGRLHSLVEEHFN
ncbi:MAG: inositol monophosphatase [Candidatus Pacebacteria bacterium]|nr:inositol monophosphatase [Candidatus Paceibacterota bacterium]